MGWQQSGNGPGRTDADPPGHRERRNRHLAGLTRTHPDTRNTLAANKEFALLRALAAEPTRVFSKEELLRDVWGFRSMGRERREGIQEAGVTPGEKETPLT
ncbi:MAG TPA: winged helix-turn-helix domain-containing protein [Solirubrobacterales bacterium]|nr:winged helix-turn-helix domain-containing protein [Solirubrobacterales bacterium]